MNLNVMTIEKLKLIIEEYSDSKIDCEFFEKIVNVLNKDELFSGIIKLEFSKNNLVMETDMNEENIGKILINFKHFLKDLPRHTNRFVNEINLDKLQLYFGMFYILHECGHVLQSLWAYKNQNEHNVVNKIYKKMIDKMNSSKYIEIIYQFNRFNFFTERNANLMSFNVLNNIYYRNSEIYLINCEYFLYNLFDIYDLKNNKSPIEKTYKLISEKEVEDTSNLTFEELVNHGFWMNEEQWKKFQNMYNIYTKPYTAIALEEEILRRIKEL